MDSGNAPTLESKKIGTLGLVINGLAYLCPACITMYYGVMNVQSGGSFPLALLIAGICMFPTALSYVKMSRKCPSGGSVFTYASEAFGYKVGFLVGWLLILDYLFFGIICALSSGIYLNAAIPAVPAWVGIVFTVFVVTFLCYKGIKMATGFNLACVVIPIVILLLLVITMCVAIAKDAPGTTGTFISGQAFYNADYFDGGGFLICVAILCNLFVGYDAVTTMADQAKNPEKSIPRAVVIIAIYTTVSFCLVGYLMNCAWVYEPGMISDPDTAVYEFATHLDASWFNLIFVPLNTLCCIGCTITSVISVSNIFRVMAENGFLPKKVFAYVHPKYGTASRGILICGGIFLIAIIFVGGLMEIANLTAFGCLLSFAVTGLAVFKVYWLRDKNRGPKAVWSFIMLPLFGAAVTLFLWANLEKYAYVVGFSWLILGLIILAIGTKGFKIKPEMNFDKIDME